MAEGSDHRKHQLRPRRRYRQGRDSQLEMAGVDFVEELPRKDDLILVLNSGSSSLKFGIYHRGAKDEEPLLTGSADGIGRSNGSLHIRSSGGRPLLQRESILESQSNAFAAVAAAIREHVPSAPVALGHRVVHGGRRLRRSSLLRNRSSLRRRISPASTMPFIKPCRRWQRAYPFRSATTPRVFDATGSTVSPTSRSCITSARSFPTEPSSLISVAEPASVLFATKYRLTPPWASLPLVASLWVLAPAILTLASSSTFCAMRSSALTSSKICLIIRAVSSLSPRAKVM